MNNTEFIDSFKCKKAFLKKRLFYLNLIQVTFTFFILPAFFFIFTDYTLYKKITPLTKNKKGKNTFLPFLFKS